VRNAPEHEPIGRNNHATHKGKQQAERSAASGALALHGIVCRELDRRHWTRLTNREISQDFWEFVIRKRSVLIWFPFCGVPFCFLLLAEARCRPHEPMAACS
jgi:hypothetical protein